MLKRFGNEYLIFLALTVIYAAYLFAFNFASFFVIIVPYLFLCFVAANRNGKSLYVLMLGVIAAGAVAEPFLKTFFFLLMAILPALIIIACNMRGSQYSWKAVVLSPLPVTFFTVAIFLLTPEIRTEIETLIVKFIEQMASDMDGAAIESLKQDGVFSAFYDHRQEAASRFVSLLPALIYMSVAFVTYFTERIFYKVQFKDILPLPDLLLLVIILSGLCLVITSLKLQAVGLNGLIITGTLYFMRGFDIVRYYMNRWRVLLFVRVVIYMLVFIHYFLNVAVAVIGFISVYKNLIKENSSVQDGR